MWSTEPAFAMNALIVVRFSDRNLKIVVFTAHTGVQSAPRFRRPANAIANVHADDANQAKTGAGQ
jgi:sugar phosphate isomerase/epimerase